MEKFEKPIEDLSSSTREYLDLKVEDLKLKTAEGLSLAFSRFFSLLLIMTVVTVIIIALAVGGTLLLGEAIGNYAASVFIIAGVFAIVLIVLLIFQKKMFLNSFVRLFIRIFYGDR